MSKEKIDVDLEKLVELFEAIDDYCGAVSPLLLDYMKTGKKLPPSFCPAINKLCEANDSLGRDVFGDAAMAVTRARGRVTGDKMWSEYEQSIRKRESER